jgi:hypothetical protein
MRRQPDGRTTPLPRAPAPPTVPGLRRSGLRPRWERHVTATGPTRPRPARGSTPHVGRAALGGNRAGGVRGRGGCGGCVRCGGETGIGGIIGSRVVGRCRRVVGRSRRIAGRSRRIAVARGVGGRGKAGMRRRDVWVVRSRGRRGDRRRRRLWVGVRVESVAQRPSSWGLGAAGALPCLRPSRQLLPVSFLYGSFGPGDSFYCARPATSVEPPCAIAWSGTFASVTVPATTSTLRSNESGPPPLSRRS